jgi:hypothetical protein
VPAVLLTAGLVAVGILAAGFAAARFLAAGCFARGFDAVLGFDAAAAFGFGFALADAAFGLRGAEVALASRAAGAASGSGVAGVRGVAARLSLRRCGRVRGSPPRTSEWRSSLIDRDMIAHAGVPVRDPPRGQPLGADLKRAESRTDVPRDREFAGISLRNLKRSEPFLVIDLQSAVHTALAQDGPDLPRRRPPAPLHCLAFKK